MFERFSDSTKKKIAMLLSVGITVVIGLVYFNFIYKPPVKNKLDEADLGSVFASTTRNIDSAIKEFSSTKDSFKDKINVEEQLKNFMEIASSSQAFIDATTTQENGGE